MLNLKLDDDMKHEFDFIFMSSALSDTLSRLNRATDSNEIHSGDNSILGEGHRLLFTAIAQ